MATKVELAKAKVAEAEALLKRVKEQAAALEEKVKAREKEQEKAMAKQRKYLAGAYVVQRMEKDEKFAAVILGELNKFLTRPSDRKKFGLPPERPAPQQTAQPATQNPPAEIPTTGNNFTEKYSG